MVQIVKPMCEYAVNPLGIDVLSPRFIWALTGHTENIQQDSFRLIVSTTPEKARDAEGDMFDSGEISSSVCHCDYRGKQLESCTRYWWRVAVKSAGIWTEYCSAQWFEMALLQEELWEGRWLGMGNEVLNVGLFRRKVRFERPVMKARVYLAAEGYVDLYVNGEKQGDAVLEPANTDFHKRLLYVTYDVTSALMEGDNVFGVRLSNGWSVHGKFRFQAYVWLDDGRCVSLSSQPGEWVMLPSPITMATIYSGEIYNGLYNRPSWCLPTKEFEETYHLEGWRMHSAYMPVNRDEDPAHFDQYKNAYYRAAELTAPTACLRAQNLEPIKIIDTVRPVEIRCLENGEQVVDFGQNFAGWIKIHLKGKAGDTVSMRFTELLNEDGTLNMEYLYFADPTYRLPMQTDVVILGETGDEEYCQSFTYHGFRYVGIAGLSTTLGLDDITGCVLSSSVPSGGSFTCSNDLINRIQESILWTEKSNLYGIPTDCPQRAERQGWLNDMTARLEESVYNFNLKRFYDKFVRDIADTQDPFSGAIADTAPARRGYRPGDPVTCFTLIPSVLHMFYGDERPIFENYEAMKKWTAYLRRNSDNGILNTSFWGDWASPRMYCGNNGYTSSVSTITPGDFVSSGYLYFNTCKMLEFAHIIGHTDDIAFFEAEKAYLKNRLNEVYYNPQTQTYATGSQGCHAFALYLKIVPENAVEAVARHMADDVTAHEDHLTTGNLFTKYLMEMLTEHGYVDTAYRLAVQKTYPSWGYMLENGATTIWERWENATGYDMNSHNHPMYGSISAWFYKYLAGVAPLEPGYRKISIRPYLPTLLNSAKATVETYYGTILSQWKKADGRITYTIQIPPCTSAVLALPSKQKDIIRGLSSKMEKAYEENGRTVITVGSGLYIVEAYLDERTV